MENQVRVGTSIEVITWAVRTTIFGDRTEQSELVLILGMKEYPTGLKGTRDEIARGVATVPMATYALVAVHPKQDGGQ